MEKGIQQCVLQHELLHINICQPAFFFFSPSFLTSYGAHIYHKGRYKLLKTFSTSALLACIGFLLFFGVFLVMKSEVIEISRLTLAGYPPENQSFVVTVVDQDSCVTQKVTPE